MFPNIEDFNFPNIKKKKLNKNAHIIEVIHSDELGTLYYYYYFYYYYFIFFGFFLYCFPFFPSFFFLDFYLIPFCTLMFLNRLDVATEPEEINFEPYQADPLIETASDGDVSTTSATTTTTTNNSTLSEKEKEKPERREDPFSVKSLFRQMKSNFAETIRQNGGF
jgi:hypothetical protein